MKKEIKTLVLSLGISLMFATPASAWLLMKPANMAEDATTTTTKIGKNAQNMSDQAGNMTIIQKIGKGFNESKAWIEKNVEKIKDFSEEVQGDIEKYKKIYTDSKEAVEKSVGGYAKIAADIKAIEKQKQEIELKIKEDEASFNAQVNAQKTSISGQIDSCTQNMSNLKKLMDENSTDKDAYEAEYQEWNAKQKALQSELDSISQDAQQEWDRISSSYKAELSDLQSQLSQLKSDLSAVSGFSSEETSSEDALLRTTNLYFLQYDEELNPQRQDKIRYNRLTERRNSIVTAAEEALSQIPEIEAKSNEAEDIGYNASTFDTTGGAWGAAARLQIENLKALSTYAHLLIEDLKRQTAVAMSGVTFYKLQKEQKNITEFNMDDYVYKKGDK